MEVRKPIDPEDSDAYRGGRPFHVSPEPEDEISGQEGIFDQRFPAVLITGPDGEPFEGQKEVEFVEAVGPLHLFRDRSARYIVYFRICESQSVLPVFFPVRCRCLRAILNRRCPTWRPKGHRSNLAIAAAVALNRLPRKGERLIPIRLFKGRIFLAQIGTVRNGRGVDPETKQPEKQPRAAWYSKVHRLLELRAGGGKRC